MTDILLKIAFSYDKPYSLKTKNIVDLKDVVDLGGKVDVMFKSGKVPSDEASEIKKIYMALC